MEEVVEQSESEEEEEELPETFDELIEACQKYAQKVKNAIEQKKVILKKSSSTFLTILKFTIDSFC